MNLAKTYFINFLLALTISIVITALRVEKSYLNVIIIFLSSLPGIFIGDLEFLIKAYWYEPETDVSNNLRSLINQKNYVGVITYIRNHRFGVEDKLIHSVLFQVIIGLISLFFVTTYSNLFVLVFSVSTFVQTFYMMWEEYSHTKNLNSWFSIFKEAPSRNFQVGYIIAISILLIYILSQMPNTI